MSAPASMVQQQETKQGNLKLFRQIKLYRFALPSTRFIIFILDKEKVYSRQYSAPILKRKSSRFGLGQFLGSVPPNTSLPGRVGEVVAPLEYLSETESGPYRPVGLSLRLRLTP